MKKTLMLSILAAAVLAGCATKPEAPKTYALDQASFVIDAPSTNQFVIIKPAGSNKVISEAELVAFINQHPKTSNWCFILEGYSGPPKRTGWDNFLDRPPVGRNEFMDHTQVAFMQLRFNNCEDIYFVQGNGSFVGSLPIVQEYH